ncbi:MAG: polysaccharide deacetylase family protein [Candidatus Goldbacteria bacterium]|nr:polysaccharide deacetylase family protein [Candidatus Goldiibacteriota bacterium]
MKKKIKITIFFTIFFPAVFMIYADDSLFTVMPWNGYKAAVSLTFDDGDPIHLDIAVPEMQKRKIRGTFFLMAGTFTRPDEWKKAAESGMEIGNHSMTHKHAYELNADNIKDEVDKAGEILRELSGQSVLAFAYPFIEITDELRKQVEKNCFIARGGGSGELYYTPDMEPDWYDIHSQMTKTQTGLETYQWWVDTAISLGAWTIFMIHAIEGSNWYEPMPKKVFTEFLDYIEKNKEKIWIAPFGEIGAYWKAQKVLEAVKPVKKENVFVFKWNRPQPFPDGVVLKIKVGGDGNKIIQAGKKIEPISSGIYPVSFDAGELTIEKINK